MSVLIAIGGGSFQRGETRTIDEYAIHCTKKEHPHVLFLPLASHDDQGYAKRFKQYYRSLGCTVESLRLLHTKLSHEEIKEKILSCDMLYIGGGDFSFLVQMLDEMKLADVIREAYVRGVICVGLSAGASLFYEYGYSDLHGDGSCFDYVKGLHLVDGIFCPHAQDKARRYFFEDESYKGFERIGCVDKEAVMTIDGKTCTICEKN